MRMPNEYPWYKVVEGEELEQGDMLWACPVVVAVVDVDHEITVDVTEFDVVVMTQSCDLANEKVEDVILCPHWDLRQAGETDSSLAKRSVHEEILKGRRPRYMRLAASDQPEVAMGIRLVDFSRIFSLPKAFVRQVAVSQGKRLRVCPPYREHLSQAFARFFMRVGLPQDIELSK
jgi:hypothetical protein